MIIDTHVHLNDRRYQDNLDQVIEEARLEGVEMLIVIGYDKSSSLKAIEIANKYPNIYCTIGIHPSEVDKFDVDNLEWIIENINNPKVVGIGEVGIDLYWDKTYKEKQIEYFKKQIEIAKTYDLPLVIHAREATNEVFTILQESNTKGVMHCYSGSLEMARRFNKIGYLLGIGGVVTFKNAHLKDVVADVELRYLLSETDSPYLAPTPYRGKTNYPKYTRIVVEEISKIKNMDFNLVQESLKENTFNLFKRLK